MNWKHAFTSSVGRKLVMGFTGLFLVIFLVVHAYINGLVFLEWLDAGRGYKAYEEAAHFMGTNPLTRIMEVGLMLGIIIHAVQGIMLTMQNKSKRPVAYNRYDGSKSSTWYSRSMGLLGTIILLFLVAHLYHFWAPNRYSQLMTGHEKDLYAEMHTVFTDIFPVILYTIGCISLAYHLLHGFNSAFRTLGMSTPKYAGLIKCAGVVFSIGVPLFFILMPLSFHFGWLPSPDEARAAAEALKAH